MQLTEAAGECSRDGGIPRLRFVVALKHVLKRRPTPGPKPSESGVDNAEPLSPMKAICPAIHAARAAGSFFPSPCHNTFRAIANVVWTRP